MHYMETNFILHRAAIMPNRHASIVETKCELTPPLDLLSDTIELNEFN